jgi:gliding motility-associated-like protein
MKLYFKYSLFVCFLLLAQISTAQTIYVETIEPNRGFAGQIISIKGVGLEVVDRVFFGSVEGEIISVSNQLVEAKVPSGATFDNISLLNSTSGLTYYSREDFFLSYGGESGISESDFDAQFDIPAGNGLYDLSITDIDGDLKNDIIGANSKSNVATIIQNTSTPGTFSFNKISPNIGAETLNTSTGDLNGDGRPEIVFTENNGNRLFILVNASAPGTFSFTLQRLTINGSNPKRVIIKDLDLDGKPDLVVSDQVTNKIYLIENTSTGGTLSFNNNITELIVENARSTSGLEVEDLNGDRRPEIITNQFLTDGGGFYVATNQSNAGSFSFSNFTQFQSSGTFVNLKVGDINGDNKPDVAATLFLSSSTVVFLNETTGNGSIPAFGAAQPINTDSRPWGLDFGDIDGDEKPDIMVATVGANLVVNILNNNSTTGSFDFQKVGLTVTDINRNIKVADIDGDSKPDIVYTSVDDDNNGITASNISILRNRKCIIPVIIPEGPITICAPDTVRLETQKIVGLTYEWYKDGTLEKTSGDNFIEIIDISGSGDYTVTIISEGGACSEISEPVNVSIISAATLTSANVTSNSPVCVGGSLSLSATDVGATKYEWRGPQDFNAAGITVTVDNFNFAKAGRYYLDVYAGSCIIETKSIVVGVIASPNFFISQSGAGTYCEGDQVTLTIGPNDPDFTYQWFNGTSPISSATGTTFSPSTSGSYQAQAIDQINTFCPEISTNTIEVNFLQIPQLEFSFPTSACSGASIAFTNESVFTNEASVNYSWDFGDGNVATDKSPTHTYNSPGAYNVTLVTSYDGFSACSSELTKLVTINGALDIFINSSSNSICEGDSITLSLDNTFNSYLWNTGETSSSISVTNEDNYSVSVTDGNGCEGTGEITIEVFPSPLVEIDASTTLISPGDTVTLTASGLFDYSWTPDSVLITSVSDIIQVVLFSTTTITVEGQDANGCYGISSVEIIVEESNIGEVLKPQKFFSPNNDAIAQYWEIDRIESYQQCGVEIYDMTGNKIYEAKPYLNDWEGTSNGNAVPDGVYYFVIRCDGEGIVKTGSITLLR